MTAAETKLLWQIGKADNNTAELAKGPGGFARLELGTEPLYVVGASDASSDWPYAHPGPGDSWAADRQHTYTIVFTIRKPPTSGDCRLLFDLVDTHHLQPPKIEISVNGRKLLTAAMPAGGPDASIMGEPAQGKQHRFEVDVPRGVLKAGANEVAIRTLSGCWMLYDWIGFQTPAEVESTPSEPVTLVRSADSPATLVRRNGNLMQTVRLTLLHVGEVARATIKLGDGEAVNTPLKPGAQVVELPVEAVETETPIRVSVTAGGRTIAQRQIVLRPVRKWTVYLLPHSHVDIGYTQLQTKIEQDHWRFYEQAIEAARRTADYPPGAQYKWNVEVLWATESYLKQATPEKRAEFIEAVRKGQIGLDALYGNQLTALCRPEELLRLMEYSQILSKECGVKIDSAMITDVPGCTWGLVTALAEAGVKYISMGPNSGARIGLTHEVWDEKPFYWVSPCGRHRVLVWIPEKGYYRVFTSGAELLLRLQGLADGDYPYNVVQLRYCLGDNHGPSFELCEIVKEWNTKYAYPKLVIGTTSEMMRDLERRHGDAIPKFRGDFTPYWEDGAGSSARETAINRAAAERLLQAEAAWAMRNESKYPDPHFPYPAKAFYTAWRNVLLYDEHTWGAHNSISEPDSDFARGQWKIKQAFALDADRQSRALLKSAKGLLYRIKLSTAYIPVIGVDVQNTSSWPRTGVIFLPAAEPEDETQLSVGITMDGKVLPSRDIGIAGADGKPVASQRLTDGSLAFVATDVPPFGAKTYYVSKPLKTGSAKAVGNTLENALLSLVIDKQTGAIASLRRKGIDADLVDRTSGMGLNDYLYVPGTDPAAATRCGPVTIRVKEPGPLVASLLIKCDAPGCRKLTREIRVIDGLDHVEIINIVDKTPIRNKEGVHFAFPFAVPEGRMRMDIPWAVAEVEKDQLPGACRNWFTVQRWVDTSNDEFGITWTTRDAPLVEVGKITAELPWIDTLEPSQTLYSYVMNNYWFTNYKADQEGPTVFRYAVRPHAGGYDAVAATRFGIEQSQPLLVVPACRNTPVAASRLTVDSPKVIVSTLKPSRDGRAVIVRLFGLGEQTVGTRLTFSDPQPESLWLSDLSEEPRKRVSGPIEVPPLGLVTVRAEFGE